MRPRIGITCNVKPKQRDRGDGRWLTMNPDFVRCVLSAGGLPLLLPPLSVEGQVDEDGIAALLEGLDGLVLSGGDDMHPRAFGQELNPSTRLQDPDRDLADQQLVRRALAGTIPILAICGGMQLVNVLLGGTLHQHLPDLQQSSYPGLLPIHHAQETEQRQHDVLLEQDSMLLELLGPEPLRTNSRHHQAVDRVAAGLAISARATDGVIEALEGDLTRFLLGVQWHPEEHVGDPRQLRLFQAMIRAAADRTNSARIR